MVMKHSREQTSETKPPVPPPPPAPGTTPEGQPPVEAEQTPPNVGIALEVSYELHRKLSMAKDLAFEMGVIPKATFNELFGKYIEWGLAIQQRQWADRMGQKQG